MRLSISIVGAVVIVVILSCGTTSWAQDYPILYQPELDNIDIDAYLKDDRLMDSQVDCVLNGGPCDEVGRWLKPRVSSAFLGECVKCTPRQAGNMQRIMSYIQKNRPREYRRAIAQYLLRLGINSLSTS